MSLIRNFIILLVLFAIASISGLFYWAGQPLDTDGKPVDFTIKPGSSVRSASRQIQEAGVPAPAFFFELLARATGKANKLKAGSYELLPEKTPYQLLDKIVNGEFSQGAVVVIEGWTFAQMRKAVDSNPDIKHDTKLLSDAELMKKINSEKNTPEGLFFPDTYLFPKGSSDLQVFQQAYVAQVKKLNEAWQSRAEGLPYKNSYEALIMASIIEKETGQKAERSMISAVFTNRLRTGMLLQTDPTVIYGLGERYQGKIHKKDLLADTPYNTYTRAGLPPTPIALPGLASLMAALNPAKSDALYFVARGDGTSVFSDNLNDHNRAVNKYQR